MNTTPSQRPRTALAICEIIGLFLFIPGLIQLLIDNTAPGVVLIVLAAAAVAAGWMIDTREKNAAQSTPGATSTDSAAA